MDVNSSVLDLIGNTPMVRLKASGENAQAQVLAKCEFMNPSGSTKDRIALQMIGEAEKRGRLKRGYTIVEASTGNTGIALSFVGRLKGYKVHIFETTSGNMSRERIKIMQSYGAEVTLITPKQINALKERGVTGAEIEVPGRIMCKDLEETNPKVWWARQFSNPANVEAHHQTGKEILAQTGGQVDAFIASVGSGGTLMGIAEILRKKRSHVRIIGVQPASSETPLRRGKSYVKSEVVGGIVCDLFRSGWLIKLS